MCIFLGVCPGRGEPVRLRQQLHLHWNRTRKAHRTASGLSVFPSVRTSLSRSLLSWPATRTSATARGTARDLADLSQSPYLPAPGTVTDSFERPIDAIGSSEIWPPRLPSCTGVRCQCPHPRRMSPMYNRVGAVAQAHHRLYAICSMYLLIR